MSGREWSGGEWQGVPEDGDLAEEPNPNPSLEGRDNRAEEKSQS